MMLTSLRRFRHVSAGGHAAARGQRYTLASVFSQLCAVCSYHAFCSICTACNTLFANMVTLEQRFSRIEETTRKTADEQAELTIRDSVVLEHGPKFAKTFVSRGMFGVTRLVCEKKGPYPETGHHEAARRDYVSDVKMQEANAGKLLAAVKVREWSAVGCNVFSFPSRRLFVSLQIPMTVCHNSATGLSRENVGYHVDMAGRIG